MELEDIEMQWLNVGGERLDGGGGGAGGAKVGDGKG